VFGRETRQDVVAFGARGLEQCLLDDHARTVDLPAAPSNDVPEGAETISAVPSLPRQTLR
jgi:hypothetical protein